MNKFSLNTTTIIIITIFILTSINLTANAKTYQTIKENLDEDLINYVIES